MMSYSENAGRFAVNELGFIQTALSSVLAAAARGELDLNRLAMEELANRGQDDRGHWIGFDQARAHFATRLAGRTPESSDTTCGSVTTTVQVLIYEYPNGTDVSVFSDEAACRATLAGIAREWWRDRADRSAPAEHWLLDDETVIASYFDGHDREFYRMEAVTMLGPWPGQAGLPAMHPAPWNVVEMLDGIHRVGDAEDGVVALVREVEVAHWMAALRNGAL